MKTSGGDSAGMMKPHGVESDGHSGVAKMDSSSATFEPLAYQLGKRLNVNVPKTVARQVKGKTSSVQDRVPGVSLDDLSPEQEKAVRNHPDFHKNSMFDWLTGNTDRHSGNSLYHADTNKVHAIDNGQMGSYFTQRPTYQSQHKQVVNVDPQGNIDFNLRESNPDAPIPQDFRDAVTNADPDEHKALMQRFFSHPNFVQAVADRRKPTVDPHWYGALGNDTKGIGDHMAQHYGERLNTLKSHFANPDVRTMGDLYQRLYPKNS